MKILERIDNYLNEGKIPKQMLDKATSYLDKKYEDKAVSLIWTDGKKWYMIEYEYGDITDQVISKTLSGIGIGVDETDLEQTQKENGFAKALRAKNAYIMDM